MLDDSNRTFRSRHETTDADTIPDMSHDTIEQVLTRLYQLKAAIEQRDEQALEEMLAGRLLWLFDHPGDLGELRRSLVGLTGDAEDVELHLLRIPEFKQKYGRVTFSVPVQLLWTDENTWEELAFNAVMHAGLSQLDDDWVIDYLGFTTSHSPHHGPIPEIPDSPVESSLPAVSEHSMAESYFGVHFNTPSFSTPWLQPYRQENHVDGYFLGSDSGYDLEAVDTSRWVPIYVPQSVLVDFLDKVKRK